MKRIVGVFAHPDDEALGPAGTIATLAKDNEVYLICATSGEAAGRTPEEKEAIGNIRRDEISQSAKVLGVKDVLFLGYSDGELCNSVYHQLAKDISQKIEDLRPDTLLTFELRGLSGHIDHVTVAMVTTYVFERYDFVRKLMYYTISKIESKRMDGYFIYFPRGFDREDVDEIIDVNHVWETKLQAMYCHKSQLGDVERTLKNTSDLPREEYFFVRTK